MTRSGDPCHKGGREASVAFTRIVGTWDEGYFARQLFGEEPVENFGVVVGDGPAVVGEVGIELQLGVAAGFFQGGGHLLAVLYGFSAVLAADEDSNGNFGQLFGGRQVAASANGNGGGETVWVLGDERPGARAAHAEAGDIETLAVDPIRIRRVLDKLGQSVRIPAAAQVALGRNDDGGEGFAVGDLFRGTVLLHDFEAIAAFATAVEEEDEGPFLVGVFLVVGGQG